MLREVKIGSSLLETITVALYEDPIILFREYIQNSLDAYNLAMDSKLHEKVTDFGVSIEIDQNERKIVIRDNGYGIEQELFEEKMLSIAVSDKVKERTNFIGFRGIGRISGLPFCEKLIFRNKVKNSTKVDICIWDGNKYNQLLEKESRDSLEEAIRKIVDFPIQGEKEKTPKEEHFFEVIIEKYNDELEDLISRDIYFKKRLNRMLPLNYSPEFTMAEKIIDKYKEFMGKDLERYMVKVNYNGEELFKNYTDDYIKESKIIFWHLRGKKTKSAGFGPKIGLLWFTFDRKLTTSEDEDYFGILVRSKNMLMGSNETTAQVADQYCDHVTTYSEMLGALRAIYGELLIDSSDLRDNASRDWFLYDKYSRDLNYIICDFINRLHRYRYKASSYFRKNSKVEEESMLKVLDELVNLKKNKIDFDLYKREEEGPEILTLADQDVPNEGILFKRIYNKIILIIMEFFKKNKKYDSFLKLRAFISKELSKK